jgi:hypothetical protein
MSFPSLRLHRIQPSLSTPSQRANSYGAEIGRLRSSGLSGEELFFELAPQDLTRAAEDPRASDVLYIGALAAPNTTDTIP